MRGSPDERIVTAALHGDRQALEELVTASLPLLYNVVGRALHGHPDTDDVVQDTALRMLRGLPGLRDPGAYRSWLVATAIHRIRDHMQARQRTRQRQAPLEEVAEVADPHADFAELTTLRLGLSGQRREVAEATRWLDDEHRELLSLWWLEESGELARTDLVAALGLSSRHVAVRVQRMKEQLDTGRTIVRALGATPGCRDLTALAGGWDGAPGSVWRKRFARHIRDCPSCAGANTGLIPAEHLLAGLSLLPLPAALTRSVPALLTGQAAAMPGATAGWQPVAAPPGGTRLLGTVSRVKVLVGGPLVLAGVAAAAVGITSARATPVAAPVAPASPVPSSRQSPSPARRLPPPVVAVQPAKPAGICRKGVSTWAFAGANRSLAASRACWFYTWAADPLGVQGPRGVPYVPMLWGTRSVTPAGLAAVRRHGPVLLTFNEPDNAGQSNMSPAQALALWPKVMATGMRLGSPGVATGAATPGGWLDRFMAGAAARHYRVDFITLHWYGSDFRTAAAVGQLRSYIQAVYARYHRPIWLTEYALIRFGGGPKYPAPEQQAAFVRASAAMLEALPYLERYAWFSLPATPGSGTGLFTVSGTPTPAGVAFQSLRSRPA